MEKQDKDTIKELADAVLSDTIVSGSEFITVLGNTVEKYVDGLIENFVDTSSMSKEDVELLKTYLIEASNRDIEENKQ